MNYPLLELHYYLKEHSHSMNAIVRNKCESELLGLFVEAAQSLGIAVELESKAFEEGGLKEFWKFLGKNNNQITLLLVIVALLLSRIPISNEEKEALGTELTQLQIEEKKLQIKKLKKELGKTNPDVEVTGEAVEVLNKNPKIVVRRSNFYKQLSAYQKVESIGVTPFNSQLYALIDENIINRPLFQKFILSTHSIKPVVVDDAIIEIVSPVLKEGNYKWKGVFNDEPLSFTMQDGEFRNLVLREDITFKHGTFIECVLNEYRKLDEVGEVIVTGYSVSTVIRKFDESQSFETNQGRKYKHTKKLKESQTDIFSNQ